MSTCMCVLCIDKIWKWKSTLGKIIQQNQTKWEEKNKQINKHKRMHKKKLKNMYDVRCVTKSQWIVQQENQTSAHSKFVGFFFFCPISVSHLFYCRFHRSFSFSISLYHLAVASHLQVEFSKEIIARFGNIEIWLDIIPEKGKVVSRSWTTDNFFFFFRIIFTLEQSKRNAFEVVLALVPINPSNTRTMRSFSWNTRLTSSIRTKWWLFHLT